MTNITQQADKEAKRLVWQIFNAIAWKFDEREFEQAKQAAIICQRKMLKEYKSSLEGRLPTERIDILKALTKAIYKQSFKK